MLSTRIGSRLSHRSCTHARGHLGLAQKTKTRQSKPNRASLAVVAMVNVDFSSPSLVLGAALIGCGVTLLQMRNMQTQISRDADIVVAAMVSIVGSTLIFQGWRLDPLLLLCQALTTSVAFWYGLEAFRLRAKTDEGLMLPPSDQAEPYVPYYMDPQQQQQWGSPSEGQQQQQTTYPESRWGLPPPNTTSAGASYYNSLNTSSYPNDQNASFQTLPQPYGARPEDRAFSNQAESSFYEPDRVYDDQGMEAPSYSGSGQQVPYYSTSQEVQFYEESTNRSATPSSYDQRPAPGNNTWEPSSTGKSRKNMIVNDDDWE